ncbi:MAG: response regulator transcription factor [Lachnospiraceae bacterium]|nr:response regulator transcription factor [Lachnospiraceae bacterium]
MLRIAIVDDNLEDAKVLQGYLQRFSEEIGETFVVEVFDDSLDFAENYQPVWQAVLLDIDMPRYNGLNLAKEIRRADKHVCILFVTNMGQYAIRGYEVDAVDFLVKPVQYQNFSDKMQKVRNILNRAPDDAVIIDCKEGIIKMPRREIRYIGKAGNNIVWHTDRGDFRRRGNITDIEGDYLGHDFSKCNSGCIVNLRRFDRILKHEIHVGEAVLTISRGMEKSFREDLMKFMRRF